MDKIIKLLKKDTNNLENIIYRKKYIGLTKIFIIYNETLVSSDKVSDFIIRSLDNITPFFVYHKIINNIDNGSIIMIDDYFTVDNFKVLVSKLMSYDLKIVYLSEIIKE